MSEVVFRVVRGADGLTHWVWTNYVHEMRNGRMVNTKIIEVADTTWCNGPVFHSDEFLHEPVTCMRCHDGPAIDEVTYDG